MSNDYSNSENKIKRRKVSSSNTAKNKVTTSSENIESVPYTKQYGTEPKENLNRRRRSMDQNNDFDDIEKRIYYKKRDRKRARRVAIAKSIAKVMAVLIAITCILSSGVVALCLKGAPTVTKELIYSSYQVSDVVDINEIPDNMKYAIIATEDKRFYEHNGVEVKSLVRSLLNNIMADSTQGGSTIDMQVSKNLLTSEERSINRKVRDIYNAIQMNKVMTKDEILSAYLNNIYFGKASYGVAQASRTYFGEDIRNLSLAQCAMLAGITNNPARYMQHDEGKRRQKVILKNMYDEGYITNEEYIKAVNDPTPFKSEING